MLKRIFGAVARNMKKIMTIGMAMILMCSLLSPVCAEAVAASLPADGSKAWESAEYDGFLIGMPEGWDPQLFTEQTAWLRGIVPEPVISGIYWVKSLQIVQELKKLGLIEFFEPNYYVTLFDDSGNESNGWPYEMLTAEYAASYSLSGSGVRIGVIDSGVDSNNFNLQNANLLQGYNYIQGNTDTDDDVYHGTKVIQVICGDHNGLGPGGVAAGAEIVPLKCFSSSTGGTVKNIAKAIEDAVDLYQCDIINMSWGLSSNVETLYSSLCYAYGKGVILVAAAGNVTSSYPQGTKIYPAAYQEVISVSAVNSSLQVLSSSQRNDQVFVCAPGGAVPFVDGNGSVVYDSGTSFATPFIAAEIALLRELAPNLDRDTLMELMVERAVDLGDSGYDTAYGYGLLPLDVLLGQHWSRFYFSGDDSESMYSVSGWTLNHGGSRALLTSFDDNGRMIEIQILATEQDRGLFDYSFKEGNATDYILSFTDPAFIPLAPCDHFSP